MKTKQLFFIIFILLFTFSCSSDESKENFPDDDFSGTAGTFTDSRDGNSYKWVKIGNQIWMAENLAFMPTDLLKLDRSFDEARYYVFDFYDTRPEDAKKDSNYIKYGVLYNWQAAKISCPKGWHLPIVDEWTDLEKFMGVTVGGKLKEIGTKHWISPNSGASDEYGFSALPGGRKGNTGFSGTASSAYFWSNTERDTKIAIGKVLLHHRTDFSDANIPKDEAVSVRCIKD